MDTLTRQQQHFDAIAKRYFDARKDPRHIALKEAIWTSFFPRLPLSDMACCRVLEAMCGYAECYPLMLRHFKGEFDYCGFDYSQPMVDFAREKYPDIKIWKQDVTQYCDEKAFDIIFMIGGLHHVYHHREVVMRNISKSLKDTGLFICFEPTHNNLLTASIRNVIYYFNSFFDHKTERGFSSKELDSIAKDQGLTPVAQIYPGLLAYVLWYNPDAFPLLNRGSESLVKKYIRWEQSIWASRFAYYLSFATLTCYKKDSSGDSGQGEFHEKLN